MMREVRFVRADRCLLSLALAFGVVWAGCGGGGDAPQTVVPEVDPAVKAQDSMNAYKAQMKGGNPARKK